MANSHRSSWHGLSHSNSNNKQATVSQVQHSKQIGSKQQQQQQQNSQAQYKYYGLHCSFPCCPAHGAQLRQVKQSMCDLRDTCSLYGRDQYLTGLVVTCSCHSVSPRATDFMVACEAGAILPTSQQYYLIMRFKRGGLKHVTSAVHDATFTLPHKLFSYSTSCLCQGYKNLAISKLVRNAFIQCTLPTMFLRYFL